MLRSVHVYSLEVVCLLVTFDASTTVQIHSLGDVTICTKLHTLGLPVTEGLTRKKPIFICSVLSIWDSLFFPDCLSLYVYAYSNIQKPALF